MINANQCHIDDETVSRVGLRLTNTPVSVQLPPTAKVYEFSELENVFVMESDFYGNLMPEGSCFLAFQGRYGLSGTDIPVERLRNASTEDIRKMVLSNT